MHRPIVFAFAALAAALLVLTPPASSAVHRARTLCYVDSSGAVSVASSTSTTTADNPTARMLFHHRFIPPYYGDCGSYDWQVSPAYSGNYYSDTTSADAAEPPPPAPVTPALPTWRNLYDWPNGHGYVGWHTASNAPAGQYGLQAALGGNYGLWLWAVGGSAYSYSQGQYAEWTYTAPGTTRLSSAALVLSYKNKLLAHHCIDVGFRNAAGTIVAHNEHCTPVQPPDSQRQVNISVVDPAANPTSKVLYFRIRVDCGGASTCSKHIPQLDPLSTGGYARLLKADMTLVDDDNPQVAASGPFFDLGGRYTNGHSYYDLTVAAQDAGSGVARVWADHLGVGELFGAAASCDPTHQTASLDARICPDSFATTSTVASSQFSEGAHSFAGRARDVAANVGSTAPWTIYVDLTPPQAASAFTLLSFDADAGGGEIGWTAGVDPALADGTPGSGVVLQEFRTQRNGGAWGDWIGAGVPRAGIEEAATGDVIGIEVREVDAVGNVSAVASGSVTLVSLVGVDPAESDAEVTPEGALAHDWGVSLDEATLRIERQDTVAAIEDQLATLSPAAFGGLWVDEADGGKIKIASTSPGLTDGLAAQYGLPASLIVEMPAARTLAQLESIEDDVSQRFAALPLDRQPTSNVDVQTNTIAIAVADPFDADVAQIVSGIRSTYGEAVRVAVDSSQATLTACTRFKCLPPERFRAGLGIMSSSGISCTSAFRVKDGAGTLYVLTASHCGGGKFFHAHHVLGTPGDGLYPPDGDVMLIKVKLGVDWDPSPWVYRRKSDTQYTITGTARRFPIGTYVCHSGAYGGQRCEQIGKTGVTVKGRRGLVMDYSCAVEGDSGGPVYAKHLAYGTLVASIVCGSPEAAILGSETWWEPITTTQRKLKVTVIPAS